LVGKVTAKPPELRVSVIIAAWNAAEVLGACLDSVLVQELRGGFETIVVDNASTDRTAALLREYEERVRVISNDHNAAYAGGNNLAAREARGEVLFFLNSDTELLAPDVLDRVATAATGEGVGLAGPMLVNPDGSLQPSCSSYPTVLGMLLVGTGLHRLVPDRVLARVAPQFWSHSTPLDTDWLMGAALAVRADVFRELGGFWPTLYSEETDLAYRARRRGLGVRFESSARVMHIGNHSLSQRLTDAERARRQAEAEVAFLEAHYGRARRLAIRVLGVAAFGGRAIAHALVGRRPRATVYRSITRVYAGMARTVGHGGFPSPPPRG
jgi:N-acetylglucosaminyl-diphospho-decaprenol L-rhamnosyltransferase